MKKPRNYVDGKTLHNELVKWYASGKEDIPPKIVDAITQICERLGTKKNFRNYTYNDEMIGAALLSCVAALKRKKYNPEKGENPFAYFTQVAHNEFVRIINEEKKQSYVKHKSMEHHIIASLLIGETIEGPELDGTGRIESLVEKFEGKKNESDRSHDSGDDQGYSSEVEEQQSE